MSPIGLMVVDLTEVPGPVLVRYMGKDGAASFLSSHDVAARSLPASEPVVVHAGATAYHPGIY